ncbi:MAG: hypothetical protein AAFX55_16125 [Bacteroidota bacterium]
MFTHLVNILIIVIPLSMAVIAMINFNKDNSFSKNERRILTFLVTGINLSLIGVAYYLDITPKPIELDDPIEDFKIDNIIEIKGWYEGYKLNSLGERVNGVLVIEQKNRSDSIRLTFIYDGKMPVIYGQYQFENQLITTRKIGNAKVSKDSGCIYIKSLNNTTNNVWQFTKELDSIY